MDSRHECEVFGRCWTPCAETPEAMLLKHPVTPMLHTPLATTAHPHPPTGRQLTLAGPDRELAWRGIHGAPRQPTEPTHSVCAGVQTPGQTHAHKQQTHTRTCTNTHMLACMHNQQTREGPRASRCPNAPYLCILLD